MRKPEFDLEHQYQLYLQRMKLDERKMHPIQKTETRRAFMGACGQMLIMLRDDISRLTEDEAVDVLDDMVSQVSDFLLKETNRQN